MNDIFITAIEVKKVRNIENFTIPLSETERKHLIITGKNGSGKTSLLYAINYFISSKISIFINPDSFSFFKFIFKNNERIEERNKEQAKFKENHDDIIKNGKTHIKLKNLKNINKNVLLVLFKAERLVALGIPKGINKVDLTDRYPSTVNLNIAFIQYIVNLKAERSFAKDDNDIKAVAEIDAWFERFENQLKELFDAPDLKLIFDRKNYNFYIQIGNYEPFSLNQLSDGYSAVLSIVTELILRMEATGNKAHDLQGVVLIDEIETHLHVALQKKIMPFLCAFFPNIQFIVTTHSPFVISSLKNAIVCDLERKEVIREDLTGYSYDALVEAYFDTDRYSKEVTEKIHAFELLADKDILTETEEKQYYDLKHYFNELPTFRADELAVAIQQIKLKIKARKR